MRTPFPFKVLYVDGIFEIHAIVNGTPVMICQMSTGTFSGDFGPDYVLSEKEAYANANLLAGAPAMLDALKLAREYVVGVERITPRDATGKNIVTPDIEKIDAAIAKVEGAA